MGKHSYPEGTEKDRARMDSRGEYRGQHRDSEVRDDKGNAWNGGPVGDHSGRRAGGGEAGENLGGR